MNECVVLGGCIKRRRPRATAVGAATIRTGRFGPFMAQGAGERAGRYVPLAKSAWSSTDQRHHSRARPSRRPTGFDLAHIRHVKVAFIDQVSAFGGIPQTYDPFFRTRARR
jgi:hypothetical protein